MFGFAPLLKSAAATPCKPPRAAAWRGVSPYTLATSGIITFELSPCDDPFSIKNVAAASHPLEAKI